MNVTPFHQFIELVRCDDQITACLRSQERFKKDLAAIEQKKMSNSHVFEQIQNAVRTLKKELDAKELELSVTRQKKDTLEKKLITVSTAREYESLQHEQNMIDNRIEALEKSIMHAWEPYEKEKTALAMHEKEYLEHAAHLDAQEKKLQEQYAAIEETLGYLRRERQNKVASVRTDWLEKYEGLKQSVNNPVVVVQSGACTGCFSLITPQLQIRIQRHELVSCPLCRRILYQI